MQQGKLNLNVSSLLLFALLIPPGHALAADPLGYLLIIFVPLGFAALFTLASLVVSFRYALVTLILHVINVRIFIMKYSFTFEGSSNGPFLRLFGHNFRHGEYLGIYPFISTFVILLIAIVFRVIDNKIIQRGG